MEIPRRKPETVTLNNGEQVTITEEDRIAAKNAMERQQEALQSLSDLTSKPRKFDGLKRLLKLP